LRNYGYKKKIEPNKKKIKSTDVNIKDDIVESLPQLRFSQDIPVYDVIEDYDINTDSGLSECLYDLLHCIEDGYYLRWEAVVRDELGLSLTKKQEEALDELINFTDDDEDQPILHIDEIPRPNEPWYETLRKIVPQLILDPFETYEIYDVIYDEGWTGLVECLDEHAQDLSLPEGIVSPIDVIPEEIHHRLWLQSCFSVLGGIGQEEELTLEDEDQKPWRIKEFVNTLKEYKNSVQYFNLTIGKLIEMVKLPPKDEKILVESLLKKLKMKSVSEKLYGYL
jgi:hypothetical protein